MKRAAVLRAAGVLLASLAVAGFTHDAGRDDAGQPLPQTRAELSGYTETSTYADVRAFLDSLRALGAPLAFGVMGTTAGGHEIPYVIASRPLVRTPEEARSQRRRKPVVYVQGNIHGGEVEGKEALLMLLRDLAFEQRPNVLDSVILIAVPVYNVDGNEAFGPQETNRPSQQGPARVGRRPNAAGLDLNRDYIKARAPETRAALALLNAWDPDVFVDLHATNGSLHGYALTYAPPLNPASPLIWRTREWLVELQERMRARHGFETFDYGNFGTDDTPWADRLIWSPAVQAWTTFDHRPRFSTNYYGLRSGIAILSEAYSHDPFERRVKSTYAFVHEILSLAGGPGAAAWQLRHRPEARGAPVNPVPVAARLTRSPPIKTVLIEEIELTGDSARTEIGLRPGVRRTGRFREVRLPIYDRFDGTTAVNPPVSYVFPARLTGVVEMLRLHGIQVTPFPGARGRVEEFVVDSIARAEREFEGHRETRLLGEWQASQVQFGADDVVVAVSGPNAALIAWLLDPESDDGLVTWNFLDEHIAAGQPFPVRRMYPAAARPGR